MGKLGLEVIVPTGKGGSSPASTHSLSAASPAKSAWARAKARKTADL